MGDLICTEIFNKWALQIWSEKKKSQLWSRGWNTRILATMKLVPAATCSMDVHKEKQLCYKGVHLLLF